MKQGVRSWQTVLVAAAGAASLALAGCGSSASPSGAPAVSSGARGTRPGPSAVDKTPVVVALNSSPDVGEIPMLLAIDNLNKAGYKFTYRVFNGQSVADEALLTGNAQIGTEATASAVKSVLSGNPLVMFMNKSANEFALVAQSKYATVKDLNGVPVGDESPASSIHSLLLWTERRYGIKIDDVFLPNSPTRAQALLAGRFGATVVEVDDMYKILHEAPGQYHVLIKYYEQLPWLLAPNFEATKRFVQAHPGIIQAFTDQVMRITQDIYRNPDKYLPVIEQKLPQYTHTVLKQTLDQSVQAHIWGLPDKLEAVTYQDAQKTLQFYQQNGVLTAAQVQQLSNLSWIDPSFSAKALKTLGIAFPSGSVVSSS